MHFTNTVAWFGMLLVLENALKLIMLCKLCSSRGESSPARRDFFMTGIHTISGMLLVNVICLREMGSVRLPCDLFIFVVYVCQAGYYVPWICKTLKIAVQECLVRSNTTGGTYTSVERYRHSVFLRTSTYRVVCVILIALEIVLLGALYGDDLLVSGSELVDGTQVCFTTDVYVMIIVLTGAYFSIFAILLCSMRKTRNEFSERSRTIDTILVWMCSVLLFLLFDFSPLAGLINFPASVVIVLQVILCDAILLCPSVRKISAKPQLQTTTMVVSRYLREPAYKNDIVNYLREKDSSLYELAIVIVDWYQVVGSDSKAQITLVSGIEWLERNKAVLEEYSSAQVKHITRVVYDLLKAAQENGTASEKDLGQLVTFVTTVIAEFDVKSCELFRDIPSLRELQSQADQTDHHRTISALSSTFV